MAAVKNILFEDYNLTPLDRYNILFQVYRIVSNQKEDSISIRKVKAYAIFNPLTIYPLFATSLLLKYFSSLIQGLS